MENPNESFKESFTSDNITKDMAKHMPQIYEKISKEAPDLIKEVKGIKEELLRDINEEEKNNGDWFAKIVQKVIEAHAENANYEHFKHKYNSANRDMIAKKIIESNLNTSIIIGMTSGAAGGILGLLSLISVTFGEIITLTYYQLKMIYDLSIVYDKPLNIKDPEEAYKIIGIALGLKTNQVGNETIKQGVNRTGKIIANRFGKKEVLKPIQSKFGMEIKQKAIKNIATRAIPIIGVATGAVFRSCLDYINTHNVAMNTLSIYKFPELIIGYFESVNKISNDNAMSNKVLAKGCSIMAYSDDRVDINKTVLIDYIKQNHLVEDEFWDEFKDSKQDRDKDFFDDLKHVTKKEELESIYNALMLIALADRKISRNEKRILQEFIPKLNISSKDLDEDLKRLRKYLQIL